VVLYAAAGVSEERWALKVEVGRRVRRHKVSTI
jgi:hypothetical protein